MNLKLLTHQMVSVLSPLITPYSRTAPVSQCNCTTNLQRWNQRLLSSAQCRALLSRYCLQRSLTKHPQYSTAQFVSLMIYGFKKMDCSCKQVYQNANQFLTKPQYYYLLLLLLNSK